MFESADCNGAGQNLLRATTQFRELKISTDMENCVFGNSSILNIKHTQSYFGHQRSINFPISYSTYNN